MLKMSKKYTYFLENRLFLDFLNPLNSPIVHGKCMRMYMIHIVLAHLSNFPLDARRHKFFYNFRLCLNFFDALFLCKNSMPS